MRSVLPKLDGRIASAPKGFAFFASHGRFASLFGGGSHPHRKDLVVIRVPDSHTMSSPSLGAFDSSYSREAASRRYELPYDFRSLHLR